MNWPQFYKVSTIRFKISTIFSNSYFNDNISWHNNYKTYIFNRKKFWETRRKQIFSTLKQKEKDRRKSAQGKRLREFHLQHPLIDRSDGRTDAEGFICCSHFLLTADWSSHVEAAMSVRALSHRPRDRTIYFGFNWRQGSVEGSDWRKFVSLPSAPRKFTPAGLAWEKPRDKISLPSEFVKAPFSGNGYRTWPGCACLWCFQY